MIVAYENQAIMPDGRVLNNDAAGRVLASELLAGFPEDRAYLFSVWGPVPTVETIPAPTLEDKKTEKREELAAARYRYEIGGITFRGVHVTTDREDQSMITAVALSAVVDPSYTTIWKGADGYLNLDAAGVLALARQVGAHVEGAFAEEKRLAELVEAAQSEDDLAHIVWTLN